MAYPSEIGPEMLSRFKSKMPGAFRQVTYRRGENDAQVDAVPSEFKFGETDGESIKATDAVWLIFSHQLNVEPRSDDWIIEGDKQHYVISAKADDPSDIIYRVITRG